MTYLLFTMYFTQSTIVGGLNTFNSLLINRAFGFDVSHLSLNRTSLMRWPGPHLALGQYPQGSVPNVSLLPCCVSSRSIG